MLTFASSDPVEASLAVEQQTLGLDILQATSSAAPLAILVVEDNSADRYLIAASLAAAEPGCELIIAEDGDAAIQCLSSRKPDIVVLDLNLPRRSGLEVLRHIRSEKRLEGLVAVIFSSSPREAIGRDMPLADAHIQKPFDLDLFLQMGYQVMQCFRRNQGRSPHYSGAAR